MRKKLKEWIKRYWLSELVSYTLAILWWYLTFKFTKNYYISWIVVILWDYLGYYGVINNRYKIK